MVDSHAARMTASLLDRERTSLAAEAQDIADAAARFAKDVERGLACGDASRIAQQVQQFLIRAARVDAMQETAALYDAENSAKEN